MEELSPEYFRQADSLAVDLERRGLRGIALAGVSRFQRVRAPMTEHIHRGMLEIGFCLRSSLVLKTDGREMPVMPGSFFINQPDVPHSLTFRPNGLYVDYFLVRKPTAARPLLDLPAAESAALWTRLRRLPPTLPAGGRAGLIRERFTRLFRLCDQPASPWTSVRMRQIALALILLLLELAEKPADAGCSARVMQVVDLIRAHPERRFTIDDLAREAALSPTHFINQFRKATGLPPIRYQIECRIKRAKDLLLQGDLTASAVAVRLGFHSLQHFSDTFARIVGVPPARWRTSGDGGNLRGAGACGILRA